MKRYLNLNGISWVLDGDTDRAMSVRPLAQKMMHVMKMQNVNNLDHVWYTHRMEDGTVIRVERFFGRDKAYVYCEPKIYAPKKRLIKKTVRQFVPAICIKSLDDWDGRIYYSWNFQEDGNVFVCATPLWKGVQAVVEESTYPQAPDEKSKDYSDKITACINWGVTNYRDFSMYVDSEEIVDSLTDNGWDIYDIDTLDDEKYVKQIYPDASLSAYCDLSEAEYSWPGEDCFHFQTWTVPNTGECFKTDASGECCQEWYNDKKVCSAYSCCDEYLPGTFMRRIKLTEYFHHVVGTMTWIMGICWGVLTLVEDVEIKDIFDQILGKTQDRLVEREYREDEYIVLDELECRSSGDIRFKSYFGPWYYKYGTHLVQDGICSTHQTDYYDSRETRIYTYSDFCGGYIRDDCEVKSFVDKYFVVYSEAYSDETRSGEISPWTVDETGWDVHGEWDDGYFIRRYDTYTISNTFVFLLANINGEIVEIDSIEHSGYLGSADYVFEVTDSHIFDADGVPVYMYGYTLRNDKDSKHEYVRYGYFYGDHTKHFQSEKFYPHNIGVVSPLHGVFGSEEKGLYGWGQCDGYMVETEIEVEV